MIQYGTTTSVLLWHAFPRFVDMPVKNVLRTVYGTHSRLQCSHNNAYPRSFANVNDPETVLYFRDRHPQLAKILFLVGWIKDITRFFFPFHFPPS